MSANPYGVVFARPEDADALFLHLMVLHKENGIFKLNPEKVRNAIGEWLDPSERTIVIGLIRGDGGRIEGSIRVDITDVWYSDTPALVEVWNFVEPPYRSSTHAKRLIEFAKWYADNLNRSVKDVDPDSDTIPLQIGILTLTSLEAKKRLYQRLNLTQVGATFMYPNPNAVGEDRFYNERRAVTAKPHKEIAA